jgi:Uma2 family endonuclease
MVTMTGRRMSLEEFLALPDEKPNLELIDGEVCQKPMGKERHSPAQFNLLRLLLLHRITRDGQPRPELTLPFSGSGRANARVPDVVFYMPGRAPIHDPYPTEMPDLVAEVRSEGQTVDALERRLRFLREQGVPCTLLVDPELATVTVHDAGRAWTARRGEHVTLESLNGFDFDVNELLD